MWQKTVKNFFSRYFTKLLFEHGEIHGNNRIKQSWVSHLQSKVKGDSFVCLHMSVHLNLHLSSLSIGSKPQRLNVSWRRGFCHAPSGRSGQAQEWTLVTTELYFQKGNGRSLRSLEDAERKCQYQEAGFTFSCYMSARRPLLNDRIGVSVLLLASWGQTAVLGYPVCGGTEGIFKLWDAKESWRCCRWSTCWG